MEGSLGPDILPGHEVGVAPGRGHEDLGGVHLAAVTGQVERRVLVDGQLGQPGAEPGLGEEGQDGRVAGQGRHVDGRVLLPVQDINVTSLEKSGVDTLLTLVTHLLHQHGADSEVTFPCCQM